MESAGPDEREDAAQRAVTEKIEREEFARGHIGPGETPAEPRPAATIVLARPTREAPEPFEVLLLKRPSTARFAAGAYVFPGGKIDASDADPEFASRMPSTSRDAEAAAVLAALRELFEETGLLLADRDLGPDAKVRLRRELLADELSFGEAARRHDIAFTRTHVCYFARWITPARFARRYDTHFFLAELPAELDDFAPELTDEIADSLWIAPGRAVERFRAGRLPMLFPTRVTLESLSRFAHLADVFDRYATAGVEAITPRLIVRGESIRPVLPGEPGWDEAHA